MTPWTGLAAAGAALLAASAAAADGALRATERAAMRAAVPSAAIPDAARVRPADGESPPLANERAHRLPRVERRRVRRVRVGMTRPR